MPHSPARSLVRLFAALLVALSLSALLTGPAASASRGHTARDQITVVIEDFRFVPQSVTVNAGDSVRWINNDSAVHTTTSDGPGWDSGLLTPGMSFTRTFPTQGTFSYHCDIHPSMTGTITVR
ncbi:cupredoxin family copper-binding protein [Streptomyces sp. NPDC005899]|uniref:cupredoxin domain-containing protein n=1 Tax=Streptomyces sp. NPDC005899 TaxID=3155716 RepID=UPI0033E57A94